MLYEIGVDSSQDRTKQVLFKLQFQDQDQPIFPANLLESLYGGGGGGFKVTKQKLSIVSLSW